MSDVRYEIKKLRYLLSDLKYWLKNPGSVRTQRTTSSERFAKQVPPWEVRQVLILVDPVDDEEIVHELILLQ
jgi:hypothetical protein